MTTDAARTLTPEGTADVQNSAELLRRMKGWFTVDVYQVIDIVQQHAKLKVLDGYDLVVEVTSQSELESLSQKLKAEFGKEVWVEPIQKTLLA